MHVLSPTHRSYPGRQSGGDGQWEPDPDSHPGAFAVSAAPARKEVHRRVRELLGTDATEEMVAAVVRRVMELLPEVEVVSASAGQPPAPSPRFTEAGRIHVIAYGHNRPGILAAITRVLAEHDCDILDISQTVQDDRFAVSLEVGASAGQITPNEIQQALDRPARELNIRITAGYEDTARSADR